MRKILFVCTANICRSPMAETIFNALVREGDLPFNAASAGVSALEGEPMAQKAAEALAEFGFAPGEHRARQVSRKMVEEADLTLAMTSRHVSYLMEMQKDPTKIWLLTEYATGAAPHQAPYRTTHREEISDPYGGPTTAYRASVRQLLAYLEPAVERLSQQNGTL